VEFNTDHTVGDIHMYVMQAAPVDGSYDLIAGFPPKALDNPDLTIEAA
jgi:UBX domain